MVVLITGATGSVGRALARVLRRDGQPVIAAVRDLRRARNALGPEIELVDIRDERAMQSAVERADALVNLAGEGIASRAWTQERKRALSVSRVQLTRQLSEYVRRAHKPPRVFVSASAIGIYADSQAAQDERSPPAAGFLGDLCAAWEEAALRSQSARTRVVCLRLGVVLDAESGALAKLLPLFRLGLGGRLGSGRQYFSFIHLDDVLGIIRFALHNDTLQGVVNATAPQPVSNEELTRGLAKLVARPALLPVPAFALRLAMGRRAALMLQSQRILPRALQRAGYSFLYPSLHEALSEIAHRQRESTQIAKLRGASRRPSDPEGATHVLTQETRLAAPLRELFPFFSRAQNLGWITPPWMGFEILGTPPADIQEGTIIEYQIRVGPLPLRWRTRIARFEPGALFVDNQERGPYRIWWHEHRFEQLDGETKMVDRVLFRVPFGALGSLFAGAIVRGMLRRIFAYRAQAMVQRFGRSEAASAHGDLREEAAQ